MIPSGLIWWAACFGIIIAIYAVNAYMESRK